MAAVPHVAVKSAIVDNDGAPFAIRAGITRLGGDHAVVVKFPQFFAKAEAEAEPEAKKSTRKTAAKSS